jgi:plastocyanin
LLVSCSASFPSNSGTTKTPDGGDGGKSKIVQVGVGPEGDHSFLPPSITVPVGTTIQWFWYSAGHNVVSGPEGEADEKFCSPVDRDCTGAPTSDIGSTYEHTFATKGTYPYFCAPHYSVGMKGTIIVE